MTFIKYLVVLILCVMVGSLGGYFISSPAPDIRTVHWERLPDPPEKAVRIIELGAFGVEANSITVGTVSGTQYDCCSPWPANWNRVTNNKERYGPTCEQIGSSLLNELPDKPVDCAFESQFEWATEQYFAAVLPDGSVWRWHYYHGLSTILGGLTVGAAAGFLIGIVMMLVVHRHVYNSNKTPLP
jgi:hypothetical protein